MQRKLTFYKNSEVDLEERSCNTKLVKNAQTSNDLIEIAKYNQKIKC